MIFVFLKETGCERVLLNSENVGRNWIVEFLQLNLLYLSLYLSKTKRNQRFLFFKGFNEILAPTDALEVDSSHLMIFSINYSQFVSSQILENDFLTEKIPAKRIGKSHSQVIEFLPSIPTSHQYLFNFSRINKIERNFSSQTNINF